MDYEAFSPQGTMGAGRYDSRPASQAGLAMMLRDADPVMLRDLLAEIAEHHAFSWDADAMLRRVADEVRERMG